MTDIPLPPIQEVELQPLKSKPEQNVLGEMVHHGSVAETPTATETLPVDEMKYTDPEMQDPIKESDRQYSLDMDPLSPQRKAMGHSISKHSVVKLSWTEWTRKLSLTLVGVVCATIAVMNSKVGYAGWGVSGIVREMLFLFINIFEVLAIMLPFYNHWSHRMNKWVFIAIYAVVQVILNVLNIARSLHAPADFQNILLQNSVELKWITVIYNSVYWIGLVFIVPAVFQYHKTRRSETYEEMEMVRKQSISSTVITANIRSNGGTSVLDEECPTPPRPAFQSKMEDTNTEASNPKGPYSMIMFSVIVISILFVEALDILKVFLNMDLILWLIMIPIPWIALLWYSRKETFTNDYSYAIAYVYFVIGIFKMAGPVYMWVISLTMASSLTIVESRGSQLLVVASWHLFMTFAKRAIYNTAKRGFEDRVALNLCLPMVWMEHLFQKLMFVSGMRLETMFIAIVFTSVSTLVRDTGIYKRWYRKVRNLPVPADAEVWKEAHVDRFWLEMNVVNAISAFIVATAMMVDFVGQLIFPSFVITIMEGMTSGGFLAYSSMLFLTAIMKLGVHLYSEKHINKRIRGVYSRMSVNELKLINVGVPSIRRYWMKCWTYNLIVAAWACFSGVRSIVDLRKNANLNY